MISDVKIEALLEPKVLPSGRCDGLRTMMSLVQIPAETKKILGDFFPSVVALVDSIT